MIVQCQACQTKFRVPDEKFGEKAVKVRCSKCQSVFAVRRLADGTAEPVGSATAAAPSPPPPVATATVSEPALAIPAPSADPFASFGPPPELPASEKTSRGVYHAGIVASRPQRAPSEHELTRPGVDINALMAARGDAPPNLVAPSGRDPFEPASALGAELDLLTAPPPLPPAGAAPAYEDPFGDLDLAAAPAVPAPAPQGIEAPVDPFAGLELAPAAAAPPPPDAFSGLDLDAVPAPPAPTGFSFEEQPPAAAAPQGSAGVADAGFFDIPSAEAAPTTAAPGSPMGFGDEEATHTDSAPDRSFFDLPAAPPPSAAPAGVMADAPSAPLAPQSFVSATRPAARARPASVQAPVVKPVGQRVLGAVLNGLFVMAVAWGSLLAYATSRADWRFDSALLRPTELGRAIFGAKTAAAQLVLEDVASGKYEMKGGRQAFFIRGQVVNRGKSALGPARAHIELVEGERVLAQTDAWAGTPFSPEQVYNLADVAQLHALEQQQQAQAAALPAGEGRPFLALLLDPPGDLARASLRVTSDLGPRAP
jgi:predicted Zn finger-like uncharacterized protein